MTTSTDPRAARLAEIADLLDVVAIASGEAETATDWASRRNARERQDAASTKIEEQFGALLDEVASLTAQLDAAVDAAVIEGERRIAAMEDRARLAEAQLAAREDTAKLAGIVAVVRRVLESHAKTSDSCDADISMRLDHAADVFDAARASAAPRGGEGEG